MKKIFLLQMLLVLLLFTSCKEKATNPPDTPLPEGYQQDIPWPSLADSPWPMYHNDPQNTGRSKYSGPISGIIYKKIEAINMEATPVLGKDSLLFFSTSLPGMFSAYKNYSQILWQKSTQQAIHTTPILDNENNIYVLGNFSLEKYNPTGNLLWSYPVTKGILSSALTIDKNGNIYFISSDFTLNVIDKQGNFKWNFSDNRLFKNTYHVPAFSPDGNTIYLQGETVSLIAFDITERRVKWAFGATPLESVPVVDSYGNIYVAPTQTGKNYFLHYSLNSDGDIRWQNKVYHKSGSMSEDGAIDKAGNILFGSDDTLYSFSYRGNLNWKKSIGQNFMVQTTITDNLGNIYFGAWSNNNGSKVMAYNNKGTFLWEVQIDGEYFLYPPTINSDNKLIIPSFQSKNLYVID